MKRTRFPVDLGSLARIEEMIVDKFGAPNFDSLGNGSFLGFVASHDRACEALGGRLIGTNSSLAHIAGVKKKVMSIIQQLKFDKRDDQVLLGSSTEEVGSAVTSRALYCTACGFGMIGMLITSHVFAYHHTLDEILRWLKVFYYTTAGGDRKAIIPTYQYSIAEIYT